MFKCCLTKPVYKITVQNNEYKGVVRYYNLGRGVKGINNNNNNNSL